MYLYELRYQVVSTKNWCDTLHTTYTEEHKLQITQSKVAMKIFWIKTSELSQKINILLHNEEIRDLYS
jgi:hypothetical protein